MIDTVLFDYGHGGLDRKGRYVTAPSKMFEFDDGMVAYEGVINRQIGTLTKYFMYLKAPHIRIVETAPTYKDTPLSKRVYRANKYFDESSLFVSFHSNASKKHKATGFGIYTSLGETFSDKCAEYVFKSVENVSKELGIKMRAPDVLNGKYNYNRNFKVLRDTRCPAILIETLFFDNREDFNKLTSRDFQYKIAEAIADGIIKFIKYGERN